MKYGIICVYDAGRPGAANNSRWVKRKIGNAEVRAEFDGDAEARAYIRDALLPKTNVQEQLKELRKKDITTRTPPAAHWVFWASPISDSNEEPATQLEPRQRSGPAPRRASRRADSRASGA